MRSTGWLKRPIAVVGRHATERLGRRPLAVAVLIGPLAIALAGAPLAAATELGHVGRVGAHSLIDSAANGGARCGYVTTFQDGGAHWWRLARIDVRAPRVRAISGLQRVGWRFIVQRSQDHGPWQVTYRSAIQIATASTTTRAAFSPMGVKVVVPPPSGQFSNRHHYRVIVKMLWYRANGTQQGTARHLVDFYREQLDGEVNSGDGEGVCQAIKGQVV